jgi:DNA (cytosine-5)-methyltransferase 1
MKFFPFFTGIDSPGRALKKLGIEYETVGISEWNIHSILAYDAIEHGNAYNNPTESTQQQLDFLKTFTLSDDGKEVYSFDKIQKWKPAKIERLYVAMKRTKNHGSITDINPRDLPNFDFAFHGSPCQDFSVAGSRKGGVEGTETRSSLMWTTVDIVAVKKPKIVMWENVPGVLMAETKPTFDKYVISLAELGYTSYFTTLNAKEYGIPQNRERVFVISILKELNQWEDKIMGFPWPKTFDNGLRLKDFLESSVDEKYYISAEKCEKLIMQIKDGNRGHFPKSDEPQITSALGSREHRMQGWKDVAQTLCARDYKDPKIVAIPVLTPDREEKRQNGRRFKEDGEPMFTLTGQDKHGVMVKEATKKGYAEAYPGDSINLEQPNSTTRRGRVGVGVAQTLTTSCNQAVVEPNEIKCLGLLDIKGNEQCRRVYDESGSSPTLNTMQGGNREPKVYTNYRIRKLTPKECFALMGYSIQDFERASKEVAESHLYTMAGNSIVVNVLEEIFKILFLGDEPIEAQMSIDMFL